MEYRTVKKNRGENPVNWRRGNGDKWAHLRWYYYNTYKAKERVTSTIQGVKNWEVKTKINMWSARNWITVKSISVPYYFKQSSILHIIQYMFYLFDLQLYYWNRAKRKTKKIIYRLQEMRIVTWTMQKKKKKIYGI